MKRRMGVLFEGLYLHDGLLLDNTFYYYYYIAYVSAINCFGVSSLFFFGHHHYLSSSQTLSYNSLDIFARTGW